MLEASSISVDVIAERGYRTVESPAELRRLGFSRDLSGLLAPALLVPSHDLDGKPTFQVRPDSPRYKDGKAIKYETPAGSRLAIDVLPRIRAEALDASVPLFVTEGIRKADSAISRGLCCLGLIGVWGPKEEAHEEFWDRIPLDGRPACIVFDSDVALNPQVRAAAARLKRRLEARGAAVRVLGLAAGPGGQKVGLDDFLAAGRSVDELMALPDVDVAPAARGDDADEDAPRFFAGPDGLFQRIRHRDGETARQLANFTARIATEFIVSDGVEEHREFEVEAVVEGEARSVLVRAEDFVGMEWVAPMLGARAVLAAGREARDLAREAIQRLSLRDIREARLFTHIGWVEIGGEHFYLHAGGAIGPDAGTGAIQVFRDGPTANPLSSKDLQGPGPKGPSPGGVTTAVGVGVRLQPPLTDYELPEPPTGQALRKAVRASLRLTRLAPDHVAMPAYALAWGAVLGDARFGGWADGSTGRGKSVLAGLLQQHWGRRMNHENLPGSWTSTANYNETLAFLAKDALLVLDDWVPKGSKADVERSQREADRVMRAQGNGSGRGRSGRDGSSRPPRPPRGVIYSTAEATPDGQSLVARMLRLDFRGVDLLDPSHGKRLRACQRDADDGVYAAAMAAYIRWLAPQLDAVRSGFRSRMHKIRSYYWAGGRCKHPRTATTVADLLARFEVFLEFAEAAGAIDEREYHILWRRLGQAVGYLIQEQNLQQAENDPVEQYIALLSAALLSGRVHVTGPDGKSPAKSPEAWGWQEKRLPAAASDGPGAGGAEERGVGDGEGPELGEDAEESRLAHWPQGRRVGWILGDSLYLIPQATFAELQKFARDMGQHLAFGEKTIGRALFEAGKLLGRDEHRKKYTTRRDFLDRRSRQGFYHLDAKAVLAERTSNAPAWTEDDYDGPPLEDLMQERRRDDLPWDDLLLA
ncbi:DUF3854 domain-containing protein [Paludisphaera sp.]|uniref:DUF3854 domain-containing protein n=1 Tax=Paludisphaera sp. TaxID=2017432 RepID=UPI00301C304E